VDTIGLLLVVAVSVASVQDRRAGRLLLWALRTCHQRVRMVWADSGYIGTLVDFAATLGIGVQVVSKLAGQVGFRVLPGGGWWEELWRGSPDADVPCATTNACPNTTPPSSNGQCSSS
jgi:hypothetical protein